MQSDQIKSTNRMQYDSNPAIPPALVVLPVSSRHLPGPPQNCEGYPPVLLPTDLSADEQMEWFIHHDGERPLACSCICIRSDKNSTSNTLTNWEIDSTKPVIIICHGFMSWRNQMLLTHLAAGVSKEFDCHTLRFDFTGNGHSTGTWRYGNHAQEVKDLCRVIDFVRQQLQCHVQSVMGHSKAAFAVLQTAWQQEESQQEHMTIPTFCILSGRFSLPGNNDDVMQRILTKDQRKEFKEYGKITIDTRGDRTFDIFQVDIDERNELDTSPCKNIKHSTVLIIHGDNDTTVDVSNAYKFAEWIPHNELHIVKGADHSFNGLRHINELVKVIATFMTRHNTGH